MCVCVCGSVIMITRFTKAIDLHQTRSVGEGIVTISSLLNFGRPAPPGGVCAGGTKFFGFALLKPARSVCV